MYYHSNKVFERKVGYVNGLPDGKREVFNRKGVKIQEGAYEEGLEMGLWRFYTQDGRLEYQGNYNKGQRVGEWYQFNKKGKKKLISID